jgi:FkbM family methyltransferase
MDPRLKAIVKQYDESNPSIHLEVSSHKLVYAIPNVSCLWRASTLATKEPHTIAWLNSMPEGADLLDVGANVGMYTVFAAVTRKARVYAFEPESQNFGVLCRNIILNNIGDRVTSWCAALSDEQKFDKIFLSSFAVGGSCHTFGEPLDPYLETQKFPFTQGSYSTTIDTLVAGGTIPAPTYIKIDVDGLEHKVIKGAENTLRNPLVKSLLIEINSHLPEHRAIVDQLSQFGFTHDAEQFASAQRAEGYFKGVGECIFRR